MKVFISDCFVDEDALRQQLRDWRARRNEVLVIQVLHEHERYFPLDDDFLFVGMEDELRLHGDTRDLREGYLQALDAALRRMRGLCAREGCDYCLIDTAMAPGPALQAYLNARQHCLQVSVGGA